MRKRHFCLALFLLIALSTMGQTTAEEVYTWYQQYQQSRPDTNRAQLLLKLSAYYLVKPGEEKADMDTALLLARQAGELSQQLHYAQGQDDAIFWTGRVYIETGNFPAAYGLLEKLSDTSRIKLMLQIADYKVASQIGTPSTLDTALLFATKAFNLSNAIHSVNWNLCARIRFAGYYMRTGNFRQAREIFRHVFDSSLSQKQFVPLKETRGALVSWRGADTSLVTLMEDCHRALLADYFSLKDTAMIARMRPVVIEYLIADGWQFFSMARYERAEQAFLQALDIERSYPDRDIAAYDALTHAYIVRGKLDLALKYNLEAIRFLEASGNKDLDDRLYWSTGYVYWLNNKDSLSLTYYRKAVAISQQKGTIIGARFLRIYAMGMLRFNKPEEALAILQANLAKAAQHNLYDLVARRIVLLGIADCYNAMGDAKHAEPYYLENLALGEKMPVHAFTVTSWFDLASFYVKNRQYEKGAFYINKILNDKDKTTLAFKQSTDLEYMQFQVDSAAGNYLSAIGHQNLYKRMNDSLYTLTNNKQLEEVKAQFETEKKDQELLLKDNDLQHTRLLRNLLIGGAVLLILLLGVLYNRYQLKQKSNLLLQQRQETINQSNQQLQRLNDRQQKLLTEKEWLIKEVHHRVKNNLQIVISLLNMQTHYLKEDLALQAVGEAGNRIRAISLIHQKLYQEENMTTINMPDYIRELVSFLEDSCVAPRKIRFELYIDLVELDVSQSVPIGLLLNEAITNAIKYAFPSGEVGIIAVSLVQEDDDVLVLKVADNGAGLPASFDPEHNKTMGFQLMKTLSEQLEGTMTINNCPGVSVSVRFEKAMLPAG
jgi:two-component sensor histidine kinase